MISQRFNLNTAVYLLLEKDEKILLLRRFNTGWQDGAYTLPAGHLDGNESISSTMSREAEEEIGIALNPNDLQVIHVAHQMGDGEYIDFYLKPTVKLSEEPTLSEPDKCDHIDWFPKDSLPKNILPNVKSALNHIQNNEIFSEFNWKKHK